MTSPYKSALDEGYSHEEILGYLSTHPEYSQKIQGARKEGYSDQEISDFLTTYSPKKKEQQKSLPEQAGRIGAQFALGAAESAALPYELGAATITQPQAQEVAYRQNLMEDIESMQQAKEMGGFPGRDEPWNQKDEEQLQNLVEQVKEPEKAKPFVKTADIGVRGIAEKVTGINLHPKGALEKAANWYGWIKNPSNAKELIKLGTNPKELVKALIPGKEVARSLSTGTALQMAEENKYGPMGTIAAAIVGDLGGAGLPGTVKRIVQPKKTLAEISNLATDANSKKEWTSQLIGDARQAGIQLDAGTIANSNLIRMAQARAAQSALSGEALTNFRKDLSQQIVREYENVISDLGTMTFENNHQAAEAIREYVSQEENNLLKQPYTKEDLGKARSLQGRIATQEKPDFQKQLLDKIAPEEFKNSYQAGETLKTVAEDVKAPIKQEFNQRWENFNKKVENIPIEPQMNLARSISQFVKNHEGSLLLGESSAENAVLQAAKKLENALITSDGSFKGVNLNDLIKTKRTLGDVANWEFGGSNFESAYKQIVGEIDRAVESSLERFSPTLREEYALLKSEYSAFKDVFENKNVMPLFEPKNQNFNTMYNSFIANPDKLRSLEDMLFNSPRGEEVINQIKRDYAQRVLDNKNITARDIRNLEEVLGPQYGDAIKEFVQARQQAIEHPLPQAIKQPALGVKAQIPQTTATKPIGKVTTKDEHIRRKLLEQIKGKSSEQIMKTMDTVEGIQKLKKVLNLTPEGQELFNQLARFKLSEIIDKNMFDNVKENIKLGTFSGLLKTTKNKAIVKELIGAESYNRLQKLQRVAGELDASAQKFYNASKSGTTLVDAGLVSSAVVGVLTGNPFLALPAIGKIGGLQVVGRLLTDPKFLKYLEEAVLTNNKQKFDILLRKMKPQVVEAMTKATLDVQKEK
jgi:hypothetical protein